MKFATRSVLLVAVLFATRLFAADATMKKDEPISGPVSYHKHIRPIFQANCQGCHQPAKPKGGYVMTDFAKMIAGGESKDKQRAIVPKKPADSLLIQQITPAKGVAEMPKGKDALSERDVALITRWVSEGALDDTPASTRPVIDAEHPPVYTLPPVVTSLDFSPDGKLLAVAGFHEVLLHKADGSGIAARLVGLSERIESVRFSPDGKLLAVAGGQPARMGEVQVWDVEARKLKVSVPVTFDTVYGVSWSPDGKLIAFGCADNTVRAIEAESGKLVLQQGSHNDWVLETAFSLKGDHIMSVGRDMSAKLTEVATQRFVDNITSITPGALRGGLHAIERQPGEEHILVGGADGAPQLYRIFRQTARKIGDNANLIRKFPEMTGRIFSVRFDKEGKKFAAASSLDNNGQIVVYANEAKAVVPDNIKKIVEKEVNKQSPEEKMALEKFNNDGVKLIAKTEVKGSGVYAVAFNAAGTLVAAAGQDGMIRFVQTSDGTIAKEFASAPISKDAAAKRELTAPALPFVHAQLLLSAVEKESLPKDGKVVALEVQPSEIKLSRPSESIQLLITARMADGTTADVTRMVTISDARGLTETTSRGLLNPVKNGKGKLEVSLGAVKAEAIVNIAGQEPGFKYDFIHDVAPVLSKVGCNSGTCHGSKDGRNGFKLSLRGYDAIMDVRAFGDDLASRRVNVASPDDSLMLLKPVASVPHEGGQRLKFDDKYYRVIRDWIGNGAQLNLDSARVAKIEIFPKDPVIQTIGSKQQVRVLATYSNGETRDVTAESFVDSGNNDVATSDAGGLVNTLRRGEAPILARFEGSYAATTVTVMGDRSGFVWQTPPSNGRVDDLVAAKWQRMMIQPSELCSDTEFVRRVYLDLTGLPPGRDEVLAFVKDSRETKIKRDELIDKLIGCPDFVDHWANKWADLLQVNRKFLGQEGAQLFREWIRKQVDGNVPYDQFARSILTAYGSNKENPPSSYFKVLREPAETMENTTHLFLATRFNCNKCHDHPFERWTQDQYYQTAAYFAQVELKADPASGDKKIGGSAVEGAKPLYEIVGDKKAGDVTHLRTGKVAVPTYPFPAKYEVKDKEKATRREQLAAWMTSSDNRYFAMSYVNRLWGYLTGVGIIEPLDDIRAGNPPSNPELLEYLTREFIDHNFDARHVMRLICKSRAYQLAIIPNRWNADDKTNYSHALARRLPAEVLLDSVFKVTGATLAFPGVKAGTRAAQLPDSGIDLPSGFLATLGRPPRESACECERSNDIGLGSIMSLLSGPTVSDAIDDPKNEIAKLVAAQADDRALVDEIYVRVLSRHATEKEIDSALKNTGSIGGEDQKLAAELGEMEKKFAPVIAEQEKQRLDAIAKAKAELTEFEKAAAPKLAEDEKKRSERIAEADKALKDIETQAPQKLAEWEKGLAEMKDATQWVALEPKELVAAPQIKLEKLKDNSVLASGTPLKTDYTVRAESSMAAITGVKLEVIPDASLPFNGPGRAKDGNFVLNEIKLDWVAKSAADQTKFAAVKFKDARADFNQKNFDIKAAIDGKADAKKGWAIGGAIGKQHLAAFQLEKPVGDAKGATLRFTLDQKYAEGFSIGRFRLWVTDSGKPLDFGVPAGILEIVKTPLEKRTKEQVAALNVYFREADPEFSKRAQALAAAKLPLPVDPKLTGLKAALAKAEEPIKIEPKLVQLRADAKMSTQQVVDKRLTGAQDLVWALVNSPAFLFNH